MNNLYGMSLLSREQVNRNNIDERLKVLDRYGFKMAATDLAILTGGLVSNGIHTKWDNGLTGRTGLYFTKSDNNLGYIHTVDEFGNKSWASLVERRNIIRPVIDSRIAGKFAKEVRGYDGIKVVEFGNYPQMVALGNRQKELEYSYLEGYLDESDRFYTFNVKSFDGNDRKSNGSFYKRHYVCEYDSKLYIRIKANSCFGRMSFKLSDDLVKIYT